MAETPVAYQLHAALPWLLYAVWPFSRLVRAWSYPLQYSAGPTSSTVGAIPPLAAPAPRVEGSSVVGRPLTAA